MPGEMQIPDNFQRSIAAERLQGAAGKGAENLQTINQKKEEQHALQRQQQARENETAEGKNLNPDGKGNLNYHPRRAKRPPAPQSKPPRSEGGGNQFVDINA
jgi:hypothetical protein